MSGFDRIKPPEKRLLEREQSRQPDSGEADPTGRAGLFSAAGEPTTPGAGVPRTPRDGATSRVTPRTAAPEPGHAGRGSDPAADAAGQVPRPEGLPEGGSILRMECQHCGVTAPMPLRGAIKRALPLALVAPWRSHPVFATCPCGERRTWLKPKLGR